MNYLFKKMSNGWKQPIPTFCLEWTAMERAIFVEIMLRARNKKEVIPTFWHGNKCYTNIELKRGECIFVVSRYAEKMGWSSRNVRNVLKRLINMGIILQINRKSFGLVISVKNYDDLVKFANQNANQNANQSQINRRTSNKSVKSIKSEKKEKYKKEKKSFKKMPEIDKSMSPLTDNDLQENEKRELLRLGVIFQNPEDEKYYFVKNYFEKLS